MLEHKILVFFHISLWVFWLGTDLGVFLAAKMSENSSLSMETRSSVLRLGMVLDRLPRTCNALIFPSGLQLIANLEIIAVPAWIAGTGAEVSPAVATRLWMGIVYLRHDHRGRVLGHCIRPVAVKKRLVVTPQGEL